MHLREKLGKEFIVATELGGTVGTNVSKSIEDIKGYQKIDALNVIDCASARLRINSFMLAHIITTEFPELDVVPHLTCRDRSILGLQADLLGGNALGVRNILVTTGDAPDEGPYKNSKPVFNLTSLELMRLINNLNNGLDYNEKEIKGNTDFFVSATAAPGTKNLDMEVDRMRRKVEAKAGFFQTQPMYDVEKTKTFLSKAKELSTPILLGIMPLKSLKMAKFMNENVAGIDISDEVMDKIENGVKGVEIAKEFVKEIYGCEGLAGIHIMALGDVDATNEIIDFTRGLG